MLSSFGSLFGPKKGSGNNTSSLSTPNPNGEQRNQKKSASGYETEYQNHVVGNSSQTHRRSDVGLGSNSLSDAHGMGSGSRENPGSIRSRLVDQFQSSLNTTIADSIRKVCTHWDSQIHNLESNYQDGLKERNNFKSENQKLTSKVKALEEKIHTLETEVREKVTLLRELQSDHLKTAGSRKLAPSSSAISQGFEDLERRIKDAVFAQLVRLNIDDPCIQAILEHQPFLEAVEAIMAENISPSAFEAVQESERKGLLLWAIQGVIHDVLNKKIMNIYMPGLNSSELQVVKKILDIISLSEECQGIKSAHEWRADTYRRLAYWAENVKELNKHTENSAAIGEVGQIFSDLTDGTIKDITRILEPLFDKSLKGKNFSSLIMDIVDRAFQFSILIGSQAARYELRRDVGKTDDFKIVPDHLSEGADTANNWNVPLFYIVPALVKTSSEDGEVYDVPELLVHGKMYALFISSDSAGGQQDVAENTTMQLTSSANRGDLEGQDIGAITNFETSQNAVNGALNETRGMQITPRPKSPTMDSSKQTSYADTLRNGSNQSVTEFSEIKPEQEPIVISRCKDVGSGDQTPKNEPNGVTTTTASGTGENDALGEAFDMASQFGSGVQGARHQRESTKTNRMITQPGSLELQYQATQKGQKELLEGLSSSGYLPHPTKIQALSTRPKAPSITEQAAIPQQETSEAILESRFLSQNPVETEPIPPRIQTQDSATPVSHTTLAASEAEEISHPQVPFGIQLQPSLENSTSPISQNQEITPKREPEHWQPNPQLTKSDNETSLTHFSHCDQAKLSKKQRRKQKRMDGGCKPQGK
ncbi:hypothetical protein TWF225_010689 [Orbilia oligospora]|nr:hypothetical protein TWF751_000524 [Orbilia oligospora]KAF3170950.1 hypothetical protein TWF225_010689 [Orbilia oligospora]KAF3240634.1 hypothetical protein TWF128_011249 [Orbilia oligospora]KAF3243665.1 hypothetical protein TWF217_011174 [Orbilia oligospora]KAF3281846.1 hypothetical protein TWF132_011068 [Orbilia oligospora]